MGSDRLGKITLGMGRIPLKTTARPVSQKESLAHDMTSAGKPVDEATVTLIENDVYETSRDVTDTSTDVYSLEQSTTISSEVAGEETAAHAQEVLMQENDVYEGGSSDVTDVIGSTGDDVYSLEQLTTAGKS